MKNQTPLTNGNYGLHRPYGPGADRNSINPANASPVGSLVGGLKRALLLLILAGVAGVSFSGCIWVHDHHDHDHDHDHVDHHADHW